MKFHDLEPRLRSQPGGETDESRYYMVNQWICVCMTNDDS